MIRCQETIELIPLHVGDDLPADEAGRVEEHLDECALCSAEYESFAAARLVLLELRADLPARGSLWAEVARELESGAPAGAVQAVAPAPAVRSWTWLKWSSAIAAALVVMLVLPPLLRTGNPAESTPGAGSPMIQATTPEELTEFLLRNGAMAVNPDLTPAAGAQAVDAGENAPLTTPAGNRPPRPPRRF